MSNKATLSVGLVAIALAAAAAGQTPDWRRVGNAAMDLELAGLATGPVDRVWYSPAGDQLLIQTLSGKLFETNDFDRWVAAPTNLPIPPASDGQTASLPETARRLAILWPRACVYMLLASSCIAPTTVARTGRI